MGGGGGGFHSAGGGRRPVKVWNSGRTVRKALVVSTYDEFQRKGREKLGLSSEEPISVVLEGDGTQVRLQILCMYLRVRWVEEFLIQGLKNNLILSKPFNNLH